MSNIIPTPSQAQLVEGMPVIDGQATSSVKTAVTTPEGLYATNLKPLLDHYYNALHMQMHLMMVDPWQAFAQGYVLLNGTILPKENFPKWQKLVDYRLATEYETTIQLLDITSLYLRPKLINQGEIETESLPNITGNITYLIQYHQGKAQGAMSTDIMTTGKQWPVGGSYGQDIQLNIDASKSHPAYGRRAEVAPTSLLVYGYAFFGEYRGTTPTRTTYYLIDSHGAYVGQTIELADAIGYNPLHMVTTPPPATRSYTSDGEASDDIANWRYVDGQWRRATR